MAVETQGFVLNAYKEISWTSHDAVGRIRSILGIHAVGHAGSLDPFASGVLIVAVGRATKLVPYLMDLPKTYRGTFVFGRKTASGDSGGETVGRGAVPQRGLAELREHTGAFVGRILQIPPMVSAVKHEGRRLYALARDGVEVERQPRPVVVHRFELLKYEPPRVDFEVECGKGTYVRTLVEDLAARIGTVAFVEALHRTRVGRFEGTESCRLISLPCSERDGLMARAVSMGDACEHLTGVVVDGRHVHRLRQGGIPPWKMLRFEAPPKIGARVRLLGPERELLAIASLDLLPGPADRPVEQACTLRLERVL